jgi:hypothetical protein
LQRLAGWRCHLLLLLLLLLGLGLLLLHPCGIGIVAACAAAQLLQLQASQQPLLLLGRLPLLWPLLTALLQDHASGRARHVAHAALCCTRPLLQPRAQQAQPLLHLLGQRLRLEVDSLPTCSRCCHGSARWPHGPHPLLAQLHRALQNHLLSSRGHVGCCQHHLAPAGPWPTLVAQLHLSQLLLQLLLLLLLLLQLLLLLLLLQLLLLHLLLLLLLLLQLLLLLLTRLQLLLLLLLLQLQQLL